MLASILPTYLTANGTAFKLDVILSGKKVTSYEAMDSVSAIRDVLKAYRDGGEAEMLPALTREADLDMYSFSLALVIPT